MQIRELNVTSSLSAVRPEHFSLRGRHDVQTSVIKLTHAIEAEGAKVFSVVDFALGSAKVGKHLRPTTNVIFGGPMIGAEALQANQFMAFHLPLRILVLEDENQQTMIAYDNMAALAERCHIPKNHPAVLRMQQNLTHFASIAAGE